MVLQVDQNADFQKKSLKTGICWTVDLNQMTSKQAGTPKTNVFTKCISWYRRWWWEKEECSALHPPCISGRAPFRDLLPIQSRPQTIQSRAHHRAIQSRSHQRAEQTIQSTLQITLESTQQSTAAYTAKNVHNRTLQSTAAYSTEYFRGSESEHTVEHSRAHSRAPRSTGHSIPEKHGRAHCCPYIGGCTVHIAAQCPYIGGFPPFKEPTMCSRERLFCLCPLPAGKRDSSEEAFCPQKNCQEELWTIVQREAHYPLVN